MSKQKFFNYSLDGSVGVIYLYGNVGSGEKVDSERVTQELAELERKTSEIQIRINSQGGEVFEGIAIFNALRRSTANITIYIDGVAASISAVIALCGKPLKMAQNSRLMLHNVSGGTYGTAEELIATANEIKELENILAVMVSARCKMTPEEFKIKYFNGKDNWLSADECVKIGLATEIYENSGNLGASNEEVYKYTNKQRKSATEAENRLKSAISKGFIKAEDKNLYLSLAKSDFKEFENILKQKHEQFRKEVKNEVESNVNYKISCADFDFYMMVGESLGVESLKRILGNKRPFERIENYLENKPQPNWTLEDYRKFNPLYLLDNPDFHEKLKRKYGERRNVDMLEYYRKNNPEYLENNPEIYNELVNRKFNK